jgi:hypothetical protein
VSVVLLVYLCWKAPFPPVKRNEPTLFGDKAAQSWEVGEPCVPGLWEGHFLRQAGWRFELRAVGRSPGVGYSVLDMSSRHRRMVLPSAWRTRTPMQA